MRFLHRRRWPNARDAVAANGDRAPIKDCAICILRDDDCISDEQIHRAVGSLAVMTAIAGLHRDP